MRSRTAIVKEVKNSHCAACEANDKLARMGPNEDNIRPDETSEDMDEGSDQEAVVSEEFLRRVSMGTWEDDSAFPLDDLGKDFVDAMIEGDLPDIARINIMICVRNFRSWFTYYINRKIAYLDKQEVKDQSTS